MAVGLLADLVLGEPPVRPHPVSAFGSAMRAVERQIYADRRPAGATHAALGAGGAWLAGAVLGAGLGDGRATALATYVASAGRALVDAAGLVGALLAEGDVERARAALPSLVGRDTEDLDEKDMARAVVESVAENTVDAVVAPALWAAVAGAPGVLTHRAVNTMDSVVGHRSARYARYGWASARLDDAMAWVPARVTAGLVALVRPKAAAEVWRAVRHDAPAHPSPNAGVAEAAFAGALGLRLGGASSYGGRTELRTFLGRGRPPEPADIVLSTDLCRRVTLALSGVLFGAGRLSDMGRRGRRS